MAKTFSAQTEYGAFPYQLPTKSFTLHKRAWCQQPITGQRRVGQSSCGLCAVTALQLHTHLYGIHTFKASALTSLA